MKRWIATFVIIALIAAGVIWEQIYVSQTFNELQNQLNTLIAAVEVCNDDGVDTAENKEQIAAIEKNWRQRERALCFLVKHTETFQISDSILYAKNFINFGNKEEVMSALTKLKYLLDVHHYNLGTSFENII